MSKRFSLLNIDENDENENTNAVIQQEQLDSTKYVNFARNRATPLYGHMHTRTYGVATSMYDAQKDKTAKVQFDAEVTVRKFPEEGVLEYKIKKDKLFINKREPKTVVEKLSVKTLEALYPLEVQTTLTNELVKILNHEEILARWEKIKIQLKKEYIGEAFNLYITKYDTTLRQKHNLLRTLKQEVFYTLLFHDIYTNYNSELEKKTTIAFPVQGFKNALVFNGVQKINKLKTYYNTANFNFNAQVNNAPIAASLEVTYDLDGNTFLLENATAKCVIKHNDTVLKRVETTIYHLKEKPTIQRSFETMRADIKQREKAQKEEENKNRTLKQRFNKWLNS